MDLIEVSENPNRHPWELSRTSCIIQVLRSLNIHGNILDIGCGDSYFDHNLLKEDPELCIYGVDIFLKDEDEINDENLHTVNSLDKLPDIKFDCIIMMDVLEHIEDHKEYLTNIVKRLKNDGTVFITVPAFMELFSLHDEELKHFRRYNHRELMEVINAAGLKETKWSYFYFSLVIGRLLTMNKTENLSGWNKSADSLSTKFVTWVLNADFKVLYALSKIGIHLPGLSLMSICKIK